MEFLIWGLVTAAVLVFAIGVIVAMVSTGPDGSGPVSLFVIGFAFLAASWFMSASIRADKGPSEKPEVVKAKFYQTKTESGGGFILGNGLFGLFPSNDRLAFMITTASGDLEVPEADWRTLKVGQPIKVRVDPAMFADSLRLEVQ